MPATLTHAVAGKSADFVLGVAFGEALPRR